MAKCKWQRWSGIFASCLLPFAFCLAADLGTITGFVKFPGESPPRNMFANASDPECPRGIAQTHLLVKQDTRGLRNCLVILDRDDRRIMPMRLQTQLTISGCQILPRIQWLPLGTSLLIVNKDGAEHHLLADQGGNRMFEARLPAGESTARRPLVIPGLYRINCEKHLWERAWIYVSPHDSVALTDSAGEFAIRNVPAGRYHARVWHEGWTEKGKTRDGRPEFEPMQELQEVRVRENQDTHLTFDHLSPTFFVSTGD